MRKDYKILRAILQAGIIRILVMFKKTNRALKANYQLFRQQPRTHDSILVENQLANEIDKGRNPLETKF